MLLETILFQLSIDNDRDTIGQTLSTNFIMENADCQGPIAWCSFSKCPTVISFTTPSKAFTQVNPIDTNISLMLEKQYSH